MGGSSIEIAFGDQDLLSWTCIVWLIASTSALAACLEPETAIGPVAISRDGSITAFFDGATDRYPHAVLGDHIEGTQLRVVTPKTAANCGLTLTLDGDHVFEDLAPHLVDVTGDGHFEAIAVRSHQSLGAQLAVYKIAESGIELLAATPYIGQSFRWLAPIGAADLDGDGHIEIAYIDRPHLAKTLRVWRYREGMLEPVASLAGLTNHRIGEDFITGGIRDCGTGPEMITVDGAWSQIIATVLNDDDMLTSHAIGTYRGSTSIVSAMQCHSR